MQSAHTAAAKTINFEKAGVRGIMRFRMPAFLCFSPIVRRQLRLEGGQAVGNHPVFSSTVSACGGACLHAQRKLSPPQAPGAAVAFFRPPPDLPDGIEGAGLLAAAAADAPGAVQMRVAAPELSTPPLMAMRAFFLHGLTSSFVPSSCRRRPCPPRRRAGSLFRAGPARRGGSDGAVYLSDLLQHGFNFSPRAARRS